LPVILAVVMIVGATIILLNLIADLVIAAVDPTIERRGPRRAHATGGVV
jgi:ABC-type dipeptide/oligopeptide/nickel transport system permease component